MQNGTTSSSSSSSTATSDSTAANHTIASSATAKQQLPHHHLHNDFIPDSFLPASQLPYSSSLAGAYLDFRSLMQQHQDLVNRHALCLTRLRQVAREVESLRDENATLRSVNRELNSHLSFIIRNQCFSSSSNMSMSSGGVLRGYDCSPAASSFDMLSGFRDLCNIGVGGGGRDDVAGAENESPTSVMEARSLENLESDRVSLPKSISVRSNGYSKTRLPTTVSAAAAAVPAACKTRGLTRSRTTIPLTTGSQKVYVRGAMQEQEPLELEVYHQGTSKTELCNKWQETGACPYGEHCQFAHGIKELRPVIRHPRYKTEVCRMIIAGDTCPYGHRCHFRHALTEEERLMGPQLKPSMQA